jgi:hypothetical protein
MREVGEVNKDGEGHPLLRNLQLRRGQAILFGDSLTQVRQSKQSKLRIIPEFIGSKYQRQLQNY